MAGSVKYIVGNWKMHGNPGMARALAAEIAAFGKSLSDVEIVLCPPALLLSEVKTALAGSRVAMGGQDCSPETEGAFTGDISAGMLKDVGCGYVIVGHSERRQHHTETSEEVRRKAKTALASGLKPIICVGETLAERQSGKAEEVVGRQVRESLPESIKSGDFILAYEPVWAIGSGQTPTAGDIRQMHTYIAGLAAKTPVLYGGSVKAANAREILSIDGVSGVLVGGASLKAEEFCKIIEAAT